MPSATNFLLGFGFTQGKLLAGYTLSKATSTHNAVKRYQDYHYDITLTFTNNGSGNYENLYYTLDPYISAEHIIYGIHNPYRCVIDDVKDNDVEIFSNGTVVFHLTGHIYRK